MCCGNRKWVSVCPTGMNSSVTFLFWVKPSPNHHLSMSVSPRPVISWDYPHWSSQNPWGIHLLEKWGAWFSAIGQLFSPLAPCGCYIQGHCVPSLHTHGWLLSPPTAQQELSAASVPNTGRGWANWYLFTIFLSADSLATNISHKVLKTQRLRPVLTWIQTSVLLQGLLPPDCRVQATEKSIILPMFQLRNKLWGWATLPKPPFSPPLGQCSLIPLWAEGFEMNPIKTLTLKIREI